MVWVLLGCFQFGWLVWVTLVWVDVVCVRLGEFVFGSDGFNNVLSTD
jgi:hypothetical protein